MKMINFSIYTNQVVNIGEMVSDLDIGSGYLLSTSTQYSLFADIEQIVRSNVTTPIRILMGDL